jgi:hypothetical protein
MISESEYLERIVAGIQSATMDQAEVTWNELINGRQFDVVARFNLGAHRFLMIYEVRNRSRPTSAMDIEAFVTKARDNCANKMVFVNRAGFQKGADTVAKRHGVDLFTIGFDDSKPTLPNNITALVKQGNDAAPPELRLGRPTLIHAISEVTLTYADGRSFKLPNERSQITYYTLQTKFEDGSTLEGLIQKNPVARRLELGEEHTQDILVAPTRWIWPPDDFYFPPGQLARITCLILGLEGRAIEGNVLIEPSAFRSCVIYKDALSDEVMTFDLDALPLGDAIPKLGSFYCQYHPLRYYHCKSAEGGFVCWELIESFQMGQLCRATMNQEIKYARFYIPVSDKKLIERLHKRLERYRNLVSKG